MKVIKNQKAQIIVIDVLFFSLITIFLIYLEVQFISNTLNNEINIQNYTKDLEIILFTDRLISDCEYFAKSAINHESLCYQNIISIDPIKINKIIYELKKKNICKISVSKDIIYTNSITQIKYTIERGVIYNSHFTTIKFYICE